MSSPKEFHIDAVYPEPLSRLRRSQGALKSDISSSALHRRAVKKQMHRGSSGRFRTQPVTFHEIKEVDEDNIIEPEGECGTGSAGAIYKSESDLKAKFEIFYRSINPSIENTTSKPQTFPGDMISGGSIETVPNIPNEIKSNPAPFLILNLKSDSPAKLEESKVFITEQCHPSPPIITTSSPQSPPASPPLEIPFNTKSRPSL